MPCAAGPYLAWISRASPLNLPLHLSYQVRERRDPLCSLARSDSSNLDAVFEHHLTLTLTLTLNPQPLTLTLTLTLTLNPSPNPTP